MNQFLDFTNHKLFERLDFIFYSIVVRLVLKEFIVMYNGFLADLLSCQWERNDDSEIICVVL